ncbi:hypothetical protein M0E87_02700 [Corynebacterium sp. CCM 9185]|uniref:Uncharacterized protein n=1 Tax=Corynebacterium marambiense TaxID=2765364 RepID=A0ABS0VVU1_9CORY|nr:hypothetical protein [Corynebacterium marambiense]MBI8999735.1 hypothetical protein [Corynebacterium marambiense]MCK7662575.1 hypothetical protein [Corynebacterium marambiense]MCX7543736.1 hypothetical protein [Corynebacterium marambiense]
MIIALRVPICRLSEILIATNPYIIRILLQLMSYATHPPGRNSAAILPLQKRADCDDELYSNLKNIAEKFSRQSSAYPTQKFTARQLATQYHAGVVLFHKKAYYPDSNSLISPGLIEPVFWHHNPNHWHFWNYSAKTYPW